MHAVLHLEHRRGAPLIRESLEEGRAQPTPLRVRIDHRRGQLPRVTRHRHARRAPERHERDGIGGLGRLVEHHVVEVRLAQQRRVGAGRGRAHDGVAREQEGLRAPELRAGVAHQPPRLAEGLAARAVTDLTPLEPGSRLAPQRDGLACPSPRELVLGGLLEERVERVGLDAGRDARGVTEPEHRGAVIGEPLGEVVDGEVARRADQHALPSRDELPDDLDQATCLPRPGRPMDEGDGLGREGAGHRPPLGLVELLVHERERLGLGEERGRVPEEHVPERAPSVLLLQLPPPRQGLRAAVEGRLGGLDVEPEAVVPALRRLVHHHREAIARAPRHDAPHRVVIVRIVPPEPDRIPRSDAHDLQIHVAARLDPEHRAPPRGGVRVHHLEVAQREPPPHPLGEGELGALLRVTAPVGLPLLLPERAHPLERRLGLLRHAGAIMGRA